MSIFHLGTEPPSSIGEFELQKVLTLSHKQDPNWIGDVDPIGLYNDHPLIVKLLDIAGRNGFRYRKQVAYTGPCLLPLYGSIGVHDDPGLGYVLNWVIDIQDFFGLQCGQAPQIVARDSFIEVKIGSLFVFNANRSHSWISNQACILAQIPVSRVKRKKNMNEPAQEEGHGSN